ncbi:MAG TPA: ATP-binding protein [Candidatus Thermoplasmatota archaeon]|nr:ATP-binding protein [Candidatus Thermoplasmatota archaeon]
MEFVNRVAELDALRGALGEGVPALIRVYGRRRLGKTEVLQKLTQELGGVYLLVDDADTTQVLASLSRQLAVETDTLAVPFRSWDDFYAHLMATIPSKFVVLDEFQRLVENDRQAVTRLQDQWDRRLRREGPSIVLCGSSVGMMQRLTSGRKGPLFGRLTRDLRLRAFDYAAVRLLYPAISELDRVRRYAVFGGTPFYHQFSVSRSLPEAIRAAFLESTSPLRDEPQSLLQFELKAHTRYNSILYEIGNGTHKLAELEKKISVKHGGLGPYMEVLKHDLDLVAMEEPVCGMKKQNRYVMTDPFFAFYYRFIFRDRPRLELGRVDAVLSDVLKDLDGYVGHIYEDVVRQALKTINGGAIRGVEIDFEQIGRWWNKAGEELDVVALGEREILAGEVKMNAAPAGPAVLQDILRKTDLMEKTYSKPIRPLIACAGGLTPEARIEADKAKAITLSLEDISSIFDGRIP